MGSSRAAGRGQQGHAGTSLQLRSVDQLTRVTRAGACSPRNDGCTKTNQSCALDSRVTIGLHMSQAVDGGSTGTRGWAMSSAPSTTHTLSSIRPCNGGTQVKYTFPNGYGASVVMHEGSYGGDAGKWELAVLDTAGHLTYATPVTNDVLGWLDDADVQKALDAIAALPKAVSA